MACSGRGGLDVRLNLALQFWRRLCRSLVLLAHYASAYGRFAHRTTGWLVGAVQWAELITGHAAWALQAVRGGLWRLCRPQHDTRSG